MSESIFTNTVNIINSIKFKFQLTILMLNIFIYLEVANKIGLYEKKIFYHYP